MPIGYIHPVTPAGAPVLPDVSFLDEFFGPEPSATDDLGKWDLVGASAGSSLADDEVNGVVTLTSNSTTEAGINLNGEPFSVRDNSQIMFVARVNLTDADGMSFFCGLAITTASIWSAVTDYIGFFSTDGNIKIGCAKDGTAAPGSSASTVETDVDSGKDFADDTWVELAFVVDGTDRVRFYVDGALVGTITSNLPDNENLTAAIQFIGSGETIDVDAVQVVMTRDRTP